VKKIFSILVPVISTNFECLVTTQLPYLKHYFKFHCVILFSISILLVIFIVFHKQNVRKLILHKMVTSRRILSEDRSFKNYETTKGTTTEPPRRFIAGEGARVPTEPEVGRIPQQACNIGRGSKIF
jgi:hypothetical protein